MRSTQHRSEKQINIDAKVDAQDCGERRYVPQILTFLTFSFSYAAILAYRRRFFVYIHILRMGDLYAVAYLQTIKIAFAVIGVDNPMT